ncbi:uncharacterized protein BXZ73DRAFT_82642 [Epithele typhae]|uniref:uncharacterized protein n=1 Tax=Epithele typhae TaxID=378194 RepID=UPI002007E19E|nr:uncharacterized protein BXZ73DRAFT_82642 [Epithele typhae]KAH9911789.1 hypothetical protein BXZ73DRAFT_82642 [Epithele typhae]
MAPSSWSQADSTFDNDRSTVGALARRHSMGERAPSPSPTQTSESSQYTVAPSSLFLGKDGEVLDSVPPLPPMPLAPQRRANLDDPARRALPRAPSSTERSIRRGRVDVLYEHSKQCHGGTPPTRRDPGAVTLKNKVAVLELEVARLRQQQELYVEEAPPDYWQQQGRASELHGGKGMFTGRKREVQYSLTIVVRLIYHAAAPAIECPRSLVTAVAGLVR